MSAAARPRFGPAGLGDSYAETGCKNAAMAVEHACSFGLNAFEYQAGHGVRLKEEMAVHLAGRAAAHGLRFSLHAPYYISMSSMEEEKRLNSLRYFLESARAVRMLGGNRVIFHPGSLGRQSREQALQKAGDTLQRARELLDNEGYGDILLCPETMGKLGQVGSLDEVLALCRLDERHIPCLDFGHLNARGQGCLAAKADYAEVLDRLAEGLQDERASGFHVHFSKIEYGPAGEKKHHNFDQDDWGPQPESLLELLKERHLAPVVICESAGRQAEDARSMRQYYEAL